MRRGRVDVERRRAAAGARARVAGDRRHRPRLLPEVEREGLLRQIDVEVEEAASQLAARNRAHQRANRRCSPCHLPSHLRHSPASDLGRGRSTIENVRVEVRPRDPLTRTFSARRARASLARCRHPPWSRCSSSRRSSPAWSTRSRAAAAWSRCPRCSRPDCRRTSRSGPTRVRRCSARRRRRSRSGGAGWSIAIARAARLRRRLRRLVPGRVGRAGGAARVRSASIVIVLLLSPPRSCWRGGTSSRGPAR